jgi:transposase
MAHLRDNARSYGKSDPIDALAVARAALRAPNLPTAALDGAAREVPLLASHRDDLVAERDAGHQPAALAPACLLWLRRCRGD